MAKKFNEQDWNRRHNITLATIQNRLRKVYEAAIEEAAKLGVPVEKLNPDKLFSSDDYPLTKKRMEKLLQGLNDRVYACIVNGIDLEWDIANNKNNELVRQVFGDNYGKLTEAQQSRYMNNNDEARKAFISRKVSGLGLSDIVWNYTNQFKTEIELALDCGIRDGVPAQDMSKELRQYLRYPDKLFRRVRGADKKLRLSKAAAAFHPGQGVYRSSYKNAMRLARTEGNIAYHTANFERWQELDFVVGIKVITSNNHPVPDICDDLKGLYPKDFKFTGWHPHCRCSTLSVLKTEKEMERDTQRILDGKEPLKGSENKVYGTPSAFDTWVRNNEERLNRAKQKPYFIRDNEKYVKKALNKPAAKPTQTQKPI